MRRDFDSSILKREDKLSASKTAPANDPFRLMVDGVVDCAIFLLDCQGYITTWNSGARRIKGYEATEVIGVHFSLFYPPEAIENGLPQRELAMAIANGRYEDEGYRVRKDGSQFWAKVVITALRGPDGELVGFGKVTRDLTEQCRAEQAVLNLEQPFQLMVEAVMDYAVFMLDTRGFITSWNRGAERIKGYRAEEILGRHFSIFYPAEEIEAGFPEVELAVAAAAGHFQDEGWRLRKDGTAIWVNVTITALRDEAGKLIGYGKVTRDLTEQQFAAEEIATAYAQVKAVLECSSDSVMTVGRDWTLLYGNHKMIEMIPDFRLGKSYWTCFSDMLSSPLEQTLRRAMEERVSVRFEHYCQKYEQWYEERLFPSDEGLSIFISNITEQKRLRDQLARELLLREKRIEALGHLAGGLVHEINHPLTIIHARARNMQRFAADEGSPLAAEVMKSCDSIVQTSERAIKILRGLEGFGRETAHDSMEYASMEEILDQCLVLQVDRFRRHKIDLRLAVQDRIPDLLCREAEIVQILTHLLNQAFDALIHSDTTKRWIALSAIVVDNDLCIEVTHSGPETEAPLRVRPIDPFVASEEVGLEMGIDLSLTRAIAQDHQGSLIRRQGTRNTCFRLVLPLDGVGPQGRSDAIH